MENSNQTLIALMEDLLCDAYEAGIKRNGWGFKAAKDKLIAAMGDASTRKDEALGDHFRDLTKKEEIAGFDDVPIMGDAFSAPGKPINSDTLIGETVGKIRHALGNYKMFHQNSADTGRTLDLVDVVTPEWEDSIKDGEVELDMLAEHIAEYLASMNLLKPRIIPSEIRLRVHGAVSTTTGDARKPEEWVTTEHHPACQLDKDHDGECGWRGERFTPDGQRIKEFNSLPLIKREPQPTDTSDDAINRIAEWMKQRYSDGGFDISEIASAQFDKWATEIYALIPHSTKTPKRESGYLCEKHQRGSRAEGAECSECYRERISSKALGRFRHHPDPAIDFCCEVDFLEGRVRNVQCGMDTKEDVAKEIFTAMQFRVGGDAGAIKAKDRLRDLEATLNSIEDGSANG